MTLHIAIPTYAAPLERLSAAVSSALQCPGVSRIWVIDDGSPMPVAQLVAQSVAQLVGSIARPAGAIEARVGGSMAENPFTDERVVVVTQTNAGPSAARNAALDHAVDATALLFLDDDDLLVPAGVAAMVHLAVRTKAAAVVASREHHRPDGIVDRVVPAQWAGGVLPSAGCVFKPISLFGASGCLVCEPALRAGVRFDLDLWHGEDRDFLRRCGDVGPIAVSEPIALRVTIHGSSGNNLTSVWRLERRVRDHLVLMARHYSQPEDAYWKEATNWLLNAVSKRPTSVREPSNLPDLLKLYQLHRWPQPLRTKLRLLMRHGFFGSNRRNRDQTEQVPL